MEEPNKAQEESNIYADTRPTGAVEQALAHIEDAADQWEFHCATGFLRDAISDIKHAIAHARRELGLERERQ